MDLDSKFKRQASSFLIGFCLWSKGDFELSKPGHAGSATEDDVPPGAVVSRPPSPSMYKVAPSKPTNGGQQVTRTTCNGNQVVTYNGRQTVTRSCNGNQVITSTAANGNVRQTEATAGNQDRSPDWGSDYP
ncbi:hypothetical protein ACOSQ3_017981 [Xanthoceras sorbifolium]